MSSSYGSYDCDFGGDDLKLVEYDVVYDEYDKEAWVGRGRSLVNYPTTSEAFASSALADFEALLNEHKGCAEIIDPGWTETKVASVIKDRDSRRYLSCQCVRIVYRWPRRDADEIKALGKISDVLKRLADQHGKEPEKK